jgi:hypothetical protein
MSLRDQYNEKCFDDRTSIDSNDLIPGQKVQQQVQKTENCRHN